jgi:hypothetical protein
VNTKLCFKLEESAIEAYERLQFVYGTKLYHIYMPENSLKSQRGM